MASHMRSLLKSKKAQFFVMSAFTIVSIIYFVSKWMEPSTILDTSQIILLDEPFIFNNIVEKAVDVITSTKTCDDLAFNLEEYKMFVRNYCLSKNYNLKFEYSVLPSCPTSAQITLNIALNSFRMTLKRSDFSVPWSQQP